MSRTVAWRELGPRTLLFVPADQADRLMPSALKSGADGVIVDLEDAVAAVAKQEARRTGAAVVAAARGSIPIVARVNAAGTPWHEADVSTMVEAGVSAIVIPKCEDPHVVMTLGEHLGPTQVEMIPMIETARGVLAAADIAAADPRVIGLAFGAEDLSAQIGLRRSRSGRELLYARSHVVLAATAAGRWAIDSPCMEAHGVHATNREAKLAHALGFSGKLVIHPAQVAPVHGALAPSAAEVAAARAVIEAFNDLTARGGAVGVVEGRMIDRPVMVAARRVVDRAGRTTEESYPWRTLSDG